MYKVSSKIEQILKTQKKHQNLDLYLMREIKQLNKDT